MSKPLGVKFVATGRYLPNKIVTNDDFVQEFSGNINPRALERALGAREHRVASKDESCSDLLVKAAQDILKKSNTTPDEISYIIVSSTPRERVEPATAAIVQRKLGIKRCSILDVEASCIGWLAGVDMATRMIATSSEQAKILVLAGTLVSRITPFGIVQHRAIFGDGAGGVLIEKSSSKEKSCVYASELWGIGEYSDVIYWPAPWSEIPETTPDFLRGYFYMGEGYRGESKLLFRLMEVYLPQCIESLWSKTEYRVEDVDLAIVHQPTKPLFDKAVECLEIPKEKIPYNYHLYGNTVSAELPITMDEAIENGKIKRGDLVLLVTFGAGITIGAMLFRY